MQSILQLGERVVVQIRKGYVDVAGEQVHFRHLAGSGTPVVCLHQTASSSQMYIKTMERLAGSHEVYAFDTPGFGGSFDPSGAPTMADYGQWIASAIRGVGISRCHLVGHHTGACIAVEIAATQPDLVQSLTLAGPVPLTAEERLEFSKHFGTPFTPVPSGAYLLDNWEYLRNLGGHHDVMLWHREMADQLRAWSGRVLSYKAVWGFDFTAAYKAVKAPLMLLCATDDVLFPFFDRSKELRPDAEAHVLSGANFEPDLDADTFAAKVMAFVARHG
jgi:pimeloyl-ACP methyl ester carboxylesterase